MAAQRFGKNQPPLRLREDAGVFLGAGVVDDGQRAVKGVGMVGRVHQHRAVGGVQAGVDLVHRALGLVRIGQAADDRPALRIEPEVGFRVGGGADAFARLGEAADVPVAVPAEGLDLAAVFRQQAVQPSVVLRLAQLAGKPAQNRQGVIELHRHKTGLAVGAQAQAVVPVGIQPGGQPVRAEMIQ